MKQGWVRRPAACELCGKRKCISNPQQFLLSSLQLANLQAAWIMHTHLATSCHPRRFLPRWMPVHHLRRGNKVTFVTLMMVLRAPKASPVKQPNALLRGLQTHTSVRERTRTWEAALVSNRKFDGVNAPAASKLLIRPKHFLFFFIPLFSTLEIQKSKNKKTFLKSLRWKNTWNNAEKLQKLLSKHQDIFIDRYFCSIWHFCTIYCQGCVKKQTNQKKKRVSQWWRALKASCIIYDTLGYRVKYFILCKLLVRLCLTCLSSSFTLLIPSKCSCPSSL